MNSYETKEPLVILKEVSKSYDGKVIIRNIGTENNLFTINDITRPDTLQGQTIGIVGASGSGKSTLFRLLAGIEEPSTGTINIPDGTNPSRYREVKGGDIGFVQQKYPLSRNDSVQTMLSDAIKQGDCPVVDRKKLIDDYLHNWDLEKQRHLSANQLSGGQRQRVAIIEQLLCSHHFIVLDEPFSGLDVKNIEGVKKDFKRITTSNEINTIFFSTHDLRLAVELSDIIYVVGYEREADGTKIPGGTIIKSFDLMKLGIAWTEYGEQHELIKAEIQSLIMAS